MKYNFY